MVGQHDASRTHAHGLRGAGNMSDEDTGRRTADAAHVVMLGQPVAVVPQLFRATGLVAHQSEGLRRITTLPDRGKIKNGEGNHEETCSDGMIGKEVTTTMGTTTMGWFGRCLGCI